MAVVLVSATRHAEEAFYRQSLLGACLSVAYQGLTIRRELFFENRRGLSACYNEALSRGQAEDVFVFVHDDLALLDFLWIHRVLSGLNGFDVVGLAGNTRRLPRQPSWAFVDQEMSWDENRFLSGVIAHGKGFPSPISEFGPVPKQCKLLDGVFLAARKKTLDEHGIGFDEQFDFHCYDLDFCRQAEVKGVRLGTIGLAAVHESAGASFLDERWHANFNRYLEKWGE